MVNPFYQHQVLNNPKYNGLDDSPAILFWECKNCGENEEPKCNKCVREDGKLVTDELE